MVVVASAGRGGLVQEKEIEFTPHHAFCNLEPIYPCSVHTFFFLGAHNRTRFAPPLHGQLHLGPGMDQGTVTSTSFKATHWVAECSRNPGLNG